MALPSTRTIVEWENTLLTEPSVAVRSRELQTLSHMKEVDPALILIVARMLIDPDPELRRLAAKALHYWEGRGVTALLVCLRCTGPEDVELRQALLRELALFGPMAGRAVPVLKSFLDDEAIRPDVEAALDRLQNGWFAFKREMVWTTGELTLMTLTLLGPFLGAAIVFQNDAKAFSLPMLIVVTALGLGAWLLGRATLSTDVVQKMQSDHERRWVRWGIMTLCIIAGMGLGVVLGKIGGAGRDAAQLVGKP
jgi:hypothetical protein